MHKLIALPFLDHGTKRWWVVSVKPRPLFTPGKEPVPIVQEAGWAPGPVWTGAGNVFPTGIRSPAVQPIASRWLALKSKLIVQADLYANYVREQSLRVWDEFYVMLSEDLHDYLQHTRMERYCLQRSNGHNFRILTCSAFWIIFPSH